MKILFEMILVAIAIFAVIHFLHFRYLRPKIVFLAGFVDSVISVALAAVVSTGIFHDSTLALASGMVCFSTSMLYVTLVPTMVDRSITVYALLSLRDAGSDGVDQEVIADRLRGNRIIEKRFEELEKTGAIFNSNGKLKLSWKGYISAVIFAFDMKFLRLGREYEIFQSGAAETRDRV